jgi:hypothetical protein
MKLTTKPFIYLFLLAASGAFAGGIHVVDDLTKEATVRPGDEIRGTIAVRNSGDRPGEVKVYQTDYLFYFDGLNIYGEPESVPRSNCSWIAFSPQQFVVPAGERAMIYYTIQVPKDGNLFGTYWSMLMVEPIPDGTLAPMTSQSGEVTMAVKTVMRYAVQIVTHIGDSGKREIKFADKQLIRKDGKWVLQLDVENTGERWLRPWVRAELYDDQGSHVGRFDGGRCRIYPACSVRQCVELADLPSGKYHALIVVDNGDDSVCGAQYALEIK